MIVKLEWTPDGISFQCQSEAGNGETIYQDIGQATEAARLVMEMDAEAYEFPSAEYPTAGHKMAEKLARAIEGALGQR